MSPERPFVLAGALLTTLVCGLASGQTKPFPQNGGYAHGFVPATVSAADALSSYTAWKAKYLLPDCGSGNYRVDNGTGNASTFSEGQGYGMVLTAYFGDRTEFDGLWKFAQKNFNADHLMGWHVTCSGATTSDGGSGSATDGDTDIGFALVVAVDQWGDAYRQPALDYLASLKAKDYTTCAPSGRSMVTNGTWDTGCKSENTSYMMPGYLRVFHEFSGDAFWGKAADDAIAIWDADSNATTGLIANEVNQNGMLGTSNENYVDYNGCRIPWRAQLDYLWYGTAGARQVTDKITNWANSIGISKLVDGYNTDGTPKGQYTQLNAWVGGWTCGAMSDSQSIVDSFASDLKAIANDNGGYYGASLRTLYLLMLSGNQWHPGGAPAGSDAGGGVASDSGAGADGGGLSGDGGSGGSSGAGASSSSGGVQGGDAGAAASRSRGGCGCGPGEPAWGTAALLLALGLLLTRRLGRRSA